jgi:copper(I)-binding protein
MKPILPLLLSLLLVPVVASAQDATKPSPITVTAPWLRATPKSAPVAGGYATITNKGAEPDVLLSASLPIAAVGEIHSMSMDHGVMHMARLDKGLEIKPGATVMLTPGGYHLMFLKPSAQLKAGESVKGALTFAKAGTIEVTFAVAGMAAKSAPGSKPSSAVDGMDMPGMDMKH